MSKRIQNLAKMYFVEFKDYPNLREKMIRLISLEETIILFYIGSAHIEIISICKKFNILE